MSSQLRWIWQQPEWPQFRWRDQELLPLLRSAWREQGMLLGKAGASGVENEPATALDTLLSNIISSSAIEDERLNARSVRSSLAKRLGLHAEHPYPTSSRSEGLAELMLDAVSNPSAPLSLERLLQWHRWLFPDADRVLHSVQAGRLRGAEPMQVVSGRLDCPTVHFEVPPRAGLEQELARFIGWFNCSQDDPAVDPLLRAAITHFWFITLHPFEDGNGRIARALADLALAQADRQSIRLYAMSTAILDHRNDYYRMLEQSQRGTLDVTDWLAWFLSTLKVTLNTASVNVERTLTKARFWHQHHGAGLSKEQVKVLNRLLDGGEKEFEQGISAAGYQKVAKVSKATATRHLAELLEKGCLQKLPGGGRSTRYQIKYPL